MPPRRIVQWSEATIDKATEEKLAGLFDRLLAMERGRDEHGRPIPKEVGLSPEAHAEWVDFYNRHRAEQVELSGDLAAAWSKLEAYAARLALIVHLCRWADGESINPNQIDVESLRSAVRLVDWFGHEAQRVYALLAKDEADENGKTLNLIRRKGGGITAGELQQYDRRFRGKADAAEAELERLVRTKLGHWEPVPTTPKGGKPTRRFVVANPSSVYETQDNHVKTDVS